jgi:hypothetical protein
MFTNSVQTKQNKTKQSKTKLFNKGVTQQQRNVFTGTHWELKSENRREGDIKCATVHLMFNIKCATAHLMFNIKCATAHLMFNTLAAIDSRP